MDTTYSIAPSLFFPKSTTRFLHKAASFPHSPIPLFTLCSTLSHGFSISFQNAPQSYFVPLAPPTPFDDAASVLAQPFLHQWLITQRTVAPSLIMIFNVMEQMILESCIPGTTGTLTLDMKMVVDRRN